MREELVTKKNEMRTALLKQIQEELTAVHNLSSLEAESFCDTSASEIFSLTALHISKLTSRLRVLDAEINILSEGLCD